MQQLRSSIVAVLQLVLLQLQLPLLLAVLLLQDHSRLGVDCRCNSACCIASSVCGKTGRSGRCPECWQHRMNNSLQQHMLLLLPLQPRETVAAAAAAGSCGATRAVPGCWLVAPAGAWRQQQLATLEGMALLLLVGSLIIRSINRVASTPPPAAAAAVVSGRTCHYRCLGRW